jgi:hypothetical protein
MMQFVLSRRALGGLVMACVAVLGVARVAPAADITVFDNGPFITGPGSGVNLGFNVSQAEPTVISVTFNANLAVGSGGPARVTDDFTIANPAGGGTHLSLLTFYGTQTTSATTNVQFGAVYVALYDGQPSAGGNLIAGDFTTNRLFSSSFSGVFRLSSSGSPSVSRPITRLTVDMSWAPRLTNGTYWIMVSAVGDTALSASANPMAFFVTPHLPTANAQQYFNSMWFNIWDVPFTLTAYCPADFDRSHGLSVQDIFDFLNAWFAGSVEADFNGNGLAVEDIFDFLNAWFAGCP